MAEEVLAEVHVRRSIHGTDVNIFKRQGLRYVMEKAEDGTVITKIVSDKE